MKKWVCLLWVVLSAVNLHGETFRFALLTDLHIKTDSMAVNDLQQAIDQVNATPDLRFVIVSGDLSDQGDRASLQKAKKLLDQIRIPCYITSGNHETKWSESGATDFGHIFGSDRFKFEYDGYLFLGFNSGPIIRMAEGHVAPQDITWIEEELQKASSGQPVFLVTHYPLLRGDVDNWYSVTDAVRKYNVKAFLNGHYHANRLESYDGIPGFICRATLRGNETHGGYSVFEVRPDSVIVWEQKIGEQPQRWGAYSMTQRYYTSDTTGLVRPDFSVNQAYPNVQSVWSVQLGNAIYSSPVHYNGRVYVGDDGGVLTCLTQKGGKILWRFKSSNRIIGTPAAADGVVVFGSADGNIYGVDAKKGTLRWKVTTSEPVLGAVAIRDGKAYIGGSDHRFRAIEIATGRELWQYDEVQGYIETRPLVYNDRVIFGAWDNTLYSLKLSDGSLAWKWNGGKPGMHYSPAAVWPVAFNGRIYITAPDRVLTAIDAASGQTLWRTGESTVRETVGISEDGTRIYSKTMRDSVVCFTPGALKPKKLWASNVGFGYELAPSMPVECGKVLFGSTMNGEVFALEAATGKVLWRHKIENSLISTVVPLNEQECLFTSSAGIVGLLKAK